jgi:hypothetical protein
MLHYIGTYTTYPDKRNYNFAPSGVSKMDYIISALSSTNNEFCIYVPHISRIKELKYYPASSEEYNGVKVLYERTFGIPNFFFKISAVIFSYYNLIKYILKLGKDDIVILYHSESFSKIIRFLRKIKKFKLIIEVEEIYSAVYNKSLKEINREIKSLSNADGFIYVNEIMNDIFSFNKPYAIAYGDYRIKRELIKKKNTSNRVKLIYAGIISSQGSDVYSAINVVEHLPENYYLEIAGYGSKENIDTLLDTIKDNKKVKYVNNLWGQEYEDFLFDSNFGFAIRDITISQYYSFPSKVMIYLSHGIIPICTPLKCITESRVAKSVIFVESNNPEDIAKQILDTDRLKYMDINKNLSELDDEFKAKFNQLIKIVSKT